MNPDRAPWADDTQAWLEILAERHRFLAEFPDLETLADLPQRWLSEHAGRILHGTDDGLPYWAER